MLEMDVNGRRVRVTGSTENCRWLILQPEDADEERMPEGTVAELARLYPDADFVVHTGNYTVGGDDSRQWSMLLDTMPAVTAGFTFAPAADAPKKRPLAM